MRFIEGAVNNGIKKDVAAGIFLKIEPFAEYGFNKSHAAAYAIIAYQTAFLKTHYPSQFFSASMSMDISNQKKLGEFFEELKRLKMNIVRPDINRCFADFKSSNGDFYYALGAIKNVGYEAISNIVIERENNGKFKSISDFINRVNPKDINKLQLEGLVKAGAFDSLLNNRQSLFCSIPKMINISKTNFENKSLNQKNLFGTDDNNQMDILIDKKDWKFEDRLNKEFEAVGFFISDHPLNQYKNIFEEFELISYEKFLNQKTKSTCNIAATILKVQEKKTSKGNPYAIVKFSDLNSVFEIFIFSEMLDNYRDMLLEGTSVILKLNQNISEINARNKITISNILPVSKFIQTSIDSIKFEIDSIEKIRILSENIQELGNTNVKIKYKYKNFISTFKLDNKRNIDRKTVDKLKKLDISSIIN